jgi:hypothetical protein
VAQPEDSVGELGLISRIGEYDLWAIEYGYRWFPDSKSADEEIPTLNRWIVDKSRNKNLWFGSEFMADDPRAQTEDLGDNAMKAGEYGIKNLQRIVPRLLLWTYERNEGYKGLTRVYTGVCNQFDYYLGHVLSYLGGTYETVKTVEQDGPVYQTVPAALQRDAMAFLGKNIFNTPRWLLDTAVLSRIGQSPTQIVSRSQDMTLNYLLSSNTLGKIASSEAMFGDKAYHMLDFFNDLDNLMWTELENYNAISIYRRNLQQSYIDKLIELNSNARSNRESRDVNPIVKNKLVEIQARIKKALPHVKDPMTIYHLRYLEEKLAKTNQS